MPAGPAASPPAAHPLAPGGSAPVGPWAFTLIEVMVALAIFFLAVFAILDSTAQSLRAARRLQVNAPDISSLAADLVLTNRVEEGVVEGDFGDLYPDYVWTREIYQVATNGLFQVDFLIRSSARRMPYEARASILLWRPESASGVTGLRR
jgi:Tfp pilus assembly protein PilV